METIVRAGLISFFTLFCHSSVFSAPKLVYENGVWNWTDEKVEKKKSSHGALTKYAHRMISVKVNNRSYTWLLDTGASRSVISKDMQRMSVSPCTPNKYVLFGVGGAVNCDGSRLERVELKGKAFSDVDVAVMNPLPIDGIDGILGMDIISKLSIGV